MYYLKLPEIGVRRLSFYLAAEEYAARHLAVGPIFFYWQVEPSVIIGRNQSLENEVNVAYCREHGIDIFRRKSGGGCVYADKSNLMLAYIADGDNVQLTYSNYVHFIVSALRRMGIDAQSTGRNDVVVGGGKVSGTAFYHIPGRNIVHGTLLYDTDMQHMERCITPSVEKLTAKGVASVKSRISLLKDHTPLTLEEIKDGLRTMLCNKTIELTADDVAKICEIEKTYLSPDFLLGLRRACDVERRGRIDGCGEVDARLWLAGGEITKIELAGDYFLLDKPVDELLAALRGVRFEKAAVREALAKCPSHDYVRGLGSEAFAKLLFPDN